MSGDHESDITSQMISIVNYLDAGATDGCKSSFAVIVTVIGETVVCPGSVVPRVNFALVGSPKTGETVKNERMVSGLIENDRAPQRAALPPTVSTAKTV